MTFLKHVLGFHIDCKETIGDPWIAGILRGLKSQALRKQSRVLKVVELQLLEKFLNDCNRSVIDRIGRMDWKAGQLQRGQSLDFSSS